MKNTDGRILANTSICAYSRFVPERADDYAWDNDRVAFRVYWLGAERMAKAGEVGGTLSSGIDCWVKRVQYPIIDKWYKMDVRGKGSYRVDHGEYLDDYHVGSSRGYGGIGVWYNDSLYVSDNFVACETTESSPIRTGFILDYAPRNSGNTTIKEIKHIPFDLSSKLTKIEIQFAFPYMEEVLAGLYIPEYNQGNVNADEKAGWFSYRSKHCDSELGIGIAGEPKYIVGYTEYRIGKPEKSHLFARFRPVDGKLIYYTGFGWRKSGQFRTLKEWNNYLSDFADCLAASIKVEIKN